MTPKLRVSGKALASLLFAEPFRRHGNKEAQLPTFKWNCVDSQNYPKTSKISQSSRELLILPNTVA